MSKPANDVNSKNKSHRAGVLAVVIVIYISSLASVFIFLQGFGSDGEVLIAGFLYFFAIILWTLILSGFTVPLLILNKSIRYWKTILIACIVNLLSSYFVIGEYSNDGSKWLDATYAPAGKTFLTKKYPDGVGLPNGSSFLNWLSFSIKPMFVLLIIFLLSLSLVKEETSQKVI